MAAPRLAPWLCSLALLGAQPALALSGDDAVNRAQQWVDVGMPYCQVPYGGCDSHVCCGASFRPEGPDWDPYRSDCSGLVSWAWDLGGPGRVTWQFAPFDTGVSYEIDATQLQPGDALNSYEHIMLFAGWADYLNVAILIDESDWGYPARRRNIPVSVSGSTVTRTDWSSNPFTAIRYTGIVNDQAPNGYLDGATCDQVNGWAQDPDLPDQSIAVHVYFNGPAGSAQATGIPLQADGSRADLCSALGSCNHAFSLATPRGLMDGAAHEVHAYGIDAQGQTNAELAQSPASITCAPAESGVRRHVANPADYAAWKFSAFQDVRPVSDADFAGWTQAGDLPSQPLLLQAPGDPAVWLVDGAFKRHVPSPEAMANWHFAWSDIQPATADQLAAMPVGPDLRGRPQLIQASGPEVDVLDDPLPALPEPDAGVSEPTDAGSEPEPDAGLEPGLDAGVEPVADAGAVTPPVSQPAKPTASPTPAHARPLRGSTGGCQGGPGGLDALALTLAIAALRRRRA